MTAFDRAAADGAALVVHQFRNSLGVILGLAELLTDPADHPADTVEMATLISQTATRLNHTVTTLGDTVAIERGRLALTPAPLDLTQLAHQLADQPIDGTAARRVTVTAPASVTVTADRARITQIVTQLLSNAAKFSPPDTPIELTVAAGPQTARLTVRDHGPGIADHHRPELFQPFARLDSRQPGIGLGLYLARHLARAHHGDLVDEPPADQGAQFTLILPRHD